jgi:hypothetical protein
MDLQQMAAVALDGVEASWLDESDKRAPRSEFEEELRAIAPEAGGSSSA